jgi:protein involved in polysaccharide export with SLBB domain
MKKTVFGSLIALSLALSPVALAQATSNDAALGQYLLGPQDKLMVRVHSLRRSVGEAVAWAPLNGEFLVSADGSVSLPIIGEIRAAGGTTSDLAEQIRKRLREAANLTETPSASVEVLRYRPFYVLGAVQQPGKYEFQPRMTVLQALSTAQGLARATELSGAEREMVTAGGDLRALEAERIALEARAARLASEIAEASLIVVPAFLAQRSEDPRVVKALREENLRFDARRAAVQAELTAIEQAKVLLQQELSSLAEKGRSLDRQIEANKRELRLVADLLTRGLTVSPRQIAAENTQVTIESNRLDVQVATLRAQQTLARANRDMVDVRTRYRKEALDDSATTRVLVDLNVERTRTAEQLLRQAETLSPASRADAEEAAPVYRLTRLTAAGTVTWMAAEDTMLEAGDVLQVTMPRAPRRGAQAAGQ